MNDTRNGIIIGIIIGFIIGIIWQSGVDGSKLKRQVRDGIQTCHYMTFHKSDDFMDWSHLTEFEDNFDLWLKHEVIHCGWVGDTFQ